MNIGLIAMAARPYHAGHAGLIQLASQENDEVHVYASMSDRKRPGEVQILGSDMEKIWREHIEPTLPSNVTVTYGGSPVANVYKELGDASESGSADAYTIYADPEDLAQNFPEKSLERYAGYLLHADRIILRPIERSQTVNVSGTKMRQFLATGDKKSFIANMPKGIDGTVVWDILSKNAQVPSDTKKVKPKKVKVEGFRRVVRKLISCK